MSYHETSAKQDNINRGNKKDNPLGTGLFIGLRTADLWLQYGILAKGVGSSLIEKLGSSTLAHGPSLITDTVVDRLGLSPYRLILLAMATGSALKQNYWILGINQEEFTPAQAGMVAAFNTVTNSLNDLLFVCAATSASVNGEHFPQTPLMVGSALYTVGILTETLSEVQRKRFKDDPSNKGKVYTGGLFGLARHINYGGYVLWRTGYAVAAGGWIYGACIFAFHTYGFVGRSIPALNHYCEERVSTQQHIQVSLLMYILVRSTMARVQAKGSEPAHTIHLLGQMDRRIAVGVCVFGYPFGRNDD